MVRRHRTKCLQCQADAARTRTLDRELKALANPMTAPSSLVPAVIVALDANDPETAGAPSSLPALVAAGCAVLTAGIVAALVRRRAVSH